MLVTASAAEAAQCGGEGVQKRNAWLEFVPSSPGSPPLEDAVGVQHHGGETHAKQQSCLDM